MDKGNWKAKKALKERPPEGSLYHYTSQDGLLGIFKDEKIWATSIHYLNDAREFAYAINLAKKELYNRRQLSPNEHAVFFDRIINVLDSNDKIILYVSSFCENGDLLSQWRGYSSGFTGFSIGFMYGKILGLSQEQGFVLSKCVYDEEIQRNKIIEILKKAYYIFTTTPDNPLDTPPIDRAVASFILSFVEVAPFFKDPSFFEEAEWRLVTRRNIPSSELKFRSGRSMIIPYTEFRLTTDNDSKLPIAKIKIGPTPHISLSKLSVYELLYSKNLLSDIEESKVPHRAW